MHIFTREKNKEHNVIINYDTGLLLRYKITDKLIKLQVGRRASHGSFIEYMSHNNRNHMTHIFTIRYSLKRNTLRELAHILDAYSSRISTSTTILSEVKNFEDLEEKHIIALGLLLEEGYWDILSTEGYKAYTHLEENTEFGRYIKIQNRF